jgi:hypothetical protein
MARHPAAIQRDLASLGPDPLAQYQAEKDTLVKELADAATAHTEQVAAYHELRASIEARLATYRTMGEAIIKALGPVLAMMQQHRDLEADLDDDIDRLIGEGSALHLSEGPPPRQRSRWPEYVAAELRRERSS